jgi:predicted alpha/beta hydrolase family esterase
MKQALILHGTDSNPEANWFPWIRAQLVEQGYQVWAPLLPNNDTPSRETYTDFLLSGQHNLTDSIVIGHSSGAVEILNLLMDERAPHIKLGMLVSAWEHGVPPGMEPAKFAKLFPAEGFDFARIQRNADKLAFMHSVDDPYCPLAQAQHLASQLNATMTVVPNGGHLGSQYTLLPGLWDIIEPNL